MVETPVLYITFARPEYACQSFAAIKKAKPKKLYFYNNKARIEKADEVKRNEKIRSFIQQIDWDCEVITWFREEYVDVFTSLWGAINWLFKNEEKGIIIEEDVVPSLAFFDYIDKTIDKFRKIENIWLISGNNALPQYFPNNFSCCMTRWADIYGWASWREKWNSVDWKMNKWPSYNGSKEMKQYWGYWPMYFCMKLFYSKFYKLINTSKYNPWDSLFLFSMRYNNGYCLIPYTNLSQDIGIIGVNHTQGVLPPLSKLGIENDKFNMADKPALLKPSSYDKKIFWKYVLPGIVKRKVKKYLHL